MCVKIVKEAGGKKAECEELLKFRIVLSPSPVSIIHLIIFVLDLKRRNGHFCNFKAFLLGCL